MAGKPLRFLLGAVLCWLSSRFLEPVDAGSIPVRAATTASGDLPGDVNTWRAPGPDCSAARLKMGPLNAEEFPSEADPCTSAQLRPVNGASPRFTGHPLGNPA